MTVTRGNGATPKRVSAPKAYEAIGRALNDHYADCADAPLPQRLVKLLACLKIADELSELRGRRSASE